MLEVDEDSRLGRELIAGGTRYHAHFVPDEETVAGFYEEACAVLEAAGVAQYEISNFARAGGESRHNLKYWTRQPYLGFGVDAHSFLRVAPASRRPPESQTAEAVRLAAPDSLDAYLAGAPPTETPVTAGQALEECFFLGLRMNRGVDLRETTATFGEGAVAPFQETVRELTAVGLLERHENRIRLTSQGRLLSNEVFERFLGAGGAGREVAISREIH
jgi:oxygen-independent coproporphyrinogen-3 oxidase